MSKRTFACAAFVVAIVSVARSARAGDPATVAAGKLIQQQFAEWKDMSAHEAASASGVFADNARIAVSGGLGFQEDNAPADAAIDFFGAVVIEPNVNDVRVGMSADGKAEWVYFTASMPRSAGAAAPKVSVRCSELVSKHGDKWQVDGAIISVGIPDAVAAKGAATNTLRPLMDVTDKTAGDPAVLAAFDALVTNGFDAPSTARKDLITVGSGPGELTTTGKGIAGYFKKAWAGHVHVTGPLLAVTGGNQTTAYVIANVSLPAGTQAAPLALPFRMFVVFDKVNGAWSPLHMHLGAPGPQ